jgi:hypothetical protein
MPPNSSTAGLGESGVVSAVVVVVVRDEERNGFKLLLLVAIEVRVEAERMEEAACVVRLRWRESSLDCRKSALVAFLNNWQTIEISRSLS